MKKTIQLNKYETLCQQIADYCTQESLPNWYTIDELLELNEVTNHHINLTYNQVKQLYKFKEQLKQF
ncbi:MAG: hypothetical protein Tp152SUR359831_14 [Prokaryotic dsDNA virus sp.]|nr:MAG: hypothetical protein Tp152SUR359831_14 [Prokaryotic dsDNA virus sp.]|tara:strand:+ start:9292 stop:9492 length:201 start_codon:yes stop_codon:yes gene_type:complete